MGPPSRNRVLIIGIYLSNKKNHAEAITNELVSSKQWHIDFLWGALGTGDIPEDLEQYTIIKSPKMIPKFSLLNQILADIDISDYQHLIVTDDDIELCEGFIDRYLAIIERRGFALSQPARTRDSYIDHYFVAQLNGVESRRSRFVEIGPLFVISKSAFPIILPFDEAAPMGWGLDLVWPKQIEKEGLSLGIVDATPIGHRLRKPVSNYDYDSTNLAMNKFLEKENHLTFSDAQVTIESYPFDDGSSYGPSQFIKYSLLND